MKMENIENTNDHYLSGWLEGKITDAQLKELVSETDFDAYQKIRSALDSLQIPNPDMEKNYLSVKAKLATPKAERQVRKFPIYKSLAIAATFALFFGLYGFFVYSNHTETAFGQLAVIELPDHSKATLNARSSINYPTLFAYSRNLKLKGECFFEVAKGMVFTVETPSGKVQVLGTRFNVVSQPGFFEVGCFEGKVKVCHKDEITILKRGQTVRFYAGTKEAWEETEDPRPLWVSGESTFRNAPLEHVISQFQNQYGLQVHYPSNLRPVRFTGSFTNKNSHTALQSICFPFQLKYTQSGNHNIIISE